MKLSEDGTSVYRTNKHKTLTFLNTATISREEALAVKDAFCRALSNEGLSDEQVENVRTKLGISGSKVDILKAGNIKPLTAAQVREVIDTYADKLNANRTGDTMLETSAEIYRGVSQKTMDKRAEKRKEVNGETLEAMSSVANSEVNSLMDLLEGGEGGESFALSSKGIARELVNELRNVFYLSGPKVNINNLLERIKDALGLTSKASAHAPAPEDDDMETLNINKLMGR